MIRNKDREMFPALYPLRRGRLLWLLILIFSLGSPLPTSAGVQDQPAAPGNAPMPEAAPVAPAQGGSAIFQKRCFMCHNKQRGDDSPFGPPNLYTAFHGKPPLTAKAAETIIVNGKGQMPAFRAILSETEIRQVIAYLRTR
jgi:mono/diheme cytochrome c family protein